MPFFGFILSIGAPSLSTGLPAPSPTTQQVEELDLLVSEFLPVAVFICHPANLGKVCPVYLYNSKRKPETFVILGNYFATK